MAGLLPPTNWISGGAASLHKGVMDAGSAIIPKSASDLAQGALNIAQGALEIAQSALAPKSTAGIPVDAGSAVSHRLTDTGSAISAGSTIGTGSAIRHDVTDAESALSRGTGIGQGTLVVGSLIGRGGAASAVGSNILQGPIDAGSTSGQGGTVAGSAFGASTPDITEGAAHKEPAIGHGGSYVWSAIGHGVTHAGSAVVGGVSDITQGAVDVGKAAGKGVEDLVGGTGKGISNGAGTVLKGVGDAGKAVADVGQAAGKGLSGIGQAGLAAGKDAMGNNLLSGLEIAAHLSKDVLDLERNIVSGVTSLGGTAVGGVITARANNSPLCQAVTTTTGVVFDPVGTALKSLDGLETLSSGLDKINGLSTKALRGIREMTEKALSLKLANGRTPTFFDPDANGIVNVGDTRRGFALLGLPNRVAKILAYALHSTFTYSTAGAWLPQTSTLPIKIDNMSKTRWGHKWGKYERLDWVGSTAVEMASKLPSWTEYFVQWLKASPVVPVVALLIFEWGTTWPFVIPPLAEMATPIVSQLSRIMHTVIFPTLSKSCERARQLTQGGAGRAA
ncbi:hypothetical protein K438DRAFT_1790833 [Mycena galopus ATCC 62051]|nr:hypothetical protein K438DRAFT_1790833 [Mycena galopus ATCC 62051]